MRNICICTWLAVCTSALGCAGGPERVTVDLVREQTFPEDDPEIHHELVRSGLLGEYYLEVGDELFVHFFYNQELNRPVVVRPDGRVTLPGIGDVMVVDRTARAVAQELQDLYSDILLEPMITVMVQSTASPKVYVIGMVDSPGPVGYSRVMSVTSAIAAAGGPTGQAKLSSVILLRRLSAEKALVVRLNIGDVLSGKNMANDMFVEPYDIVFVPKRFVSDVSDFALKLVRTVVPAMSLYTREFGE